MNIGIVTSFYNYYDRFLPSWIDSIAQLETKPAFVSMVCSGGLYNLDNIEYAKRVLEGINIPYKVDFIAHQGMGAARNKAVENSPTEWILYLDVDDIILPKAVDIYKSYEKETDVICGGLRVEGINGEVRDVLFDSSREKAAKGGWVSSSHGVYKKSFWKKSPYILHNDFVDQVLWLGFGQQGAEFKATKKVCTVYKRRADGHNLSMTDDMWKEQKEQWKAYVQKGIFNPEPKIRLYNYTSETNFGDLLSPIVVQWVSNQVVKSVDAKASRKMVALGSVMSKVKEDDLIWGTGVIQDEDIDLPRGVKILAVRGPLSASKIKNKRVPFVYGDPALLMPQIYKPPIKKKHKIGIISHYVDVDRFKIKKYHWIDVTNPDPLKTIDEILSCEKIVSTSLHGVIVAEAYGIPAIWLKVSDKIKGGNFKYHDYLLSTNRPELDPVEIYDIVTDKHIEKIQDRVLPKPVIDTEPLIRAFKNHYNKITEDKKPVNISVTIMAHPQREDFVREIQEKLGFEAHVEWDRGISLWDTARRSWLSYDPDATHHLVIQDDAILSKNLIETLEKALYHIPDKIVSLCTIDYKMNTDKKKEYRRFYNNNIRWFLDNDSLSAVATVIPTEYIEDMIKYCDTLGTPHDDVRIRTYCRLHETKVYHSVPSLVDHRPASESPSLMPKHDAKNRGERQALLFIGEDNDGLDLNWEDLKYIKN